MKIVNVFFPAWTEALGWTLLHSMWQAFVIWIVVSLFLRFTPSRFSQVRYLTTSIAMGMMLAMSVATLIYFLNTNLALTERTTFIYQRLPNNFNPHQSHSLTVEQVLMNLRNFLAANMPLIFLGWLSGAVFFFLRLVSGWWYISKLKSEAILVSDAWNERLQQVAGTLGIDRIISLAQSARIHSPVVVGFLKPVVLVPVGMLTGLSSEQIETIFIHELAHVRRHDYIINVIQSFIEAIYFFNPFVWSISNLIRREREYCCDDMVVKNYGSALAYARALTQLEEVRLTKSAFALALAENKNQLLNRIKRIMENSAKNYSGREKMIPAVLAVIGLISASWLTISSDSQIAGKEYNQSRIATDTIIKKMQKSGRSSRTTTVTTIDENGKSHTETVVEYDNDEQLRATIPPVDVVAPVPVVPPIPNIDLVIPPIPALGEFNEVQSFGAFDPNIDPIPFVNVGASQHWDEFNKAFEDFHKIHGNDLEKMMKELEKQFAHNFNEKNWSAFQSLSDNKMEKAMEVLKNFSHEDMVEVEFNTLKAAEHMEDLQNNLEKIDQDMVARSEYFKNMEEDLMQMQADMKSFEKELKENLVKDGYIGEDEEIKNINWDDDGTIEINGKKIKDSDRKKYNELHSKFFKKGRYLRNVE